MPFFTRLNPVFNLSRRPRHPLLRALSLIVAVALVGAMLVFGLVVACVLLVGGAIVFALRQSTRQRSGAPAASASHGTHRPEVLEGEFVVLHETRHAAR
ncbi:hypothetical protein [Dyella sp.]|uniref:hypothetical protein n=1 Tax=Dyella sp. TaxID=1869338 RepID=UPI002ED16C1B